MYISKSNGPNTDPCGTPQEIVQRLESNFPMVTPISIDIA